MKIRVFTLTAFLFPALASAMPPPGTINLHGSCRITRPSGTQEIPLGPTFGSHLHVLGYVGDDGGDYEINIANNGGTTFEREMGALSVGFARANAVFRNPPLLCPTSPEDRRKACEDENLRNHPPFVPAPSDRFSRKANLDGNVKYEFLGSSPDNFQVSKIAVPGSRIVDLNPVAIETPHASLGGVLASCSLSATRN